jgi:hypothetical protein
MHSVAGECPGHRGYVHSRGTAIRGTAIRGTAIRGTAIKGTAIKGTAIKGTANYPYKKSPVLSQHGA